MAAQREVTEKKNAAALLGPVTPHFATLNPRPRRTLGRSLDSFSPFPHEKE